MPTISKIATGAAVAAGSPFNGSFTNEQLARVATSDATAAGSNTYATAAPGKNQEYASLWPFAFTSAEVPDGSVINSVAVKVQWKASTNASVAELRSSLFADSAQTTPLTAVPAVSNTAEPTADTDATYSASTLPTVQQLRDGLWVRVQALRGNSNTAVTLSLDYIQVTVDYSDPPAAVTGSGGVSFGFSIGGSGTASLPSATGTGGVAFGFALAGTGSASVPSFTGSGGVTFAFTTGGSGTYQPAPITGTGGVAFGYGLAGTGSVTAPTFTASGGVAFGFASSGLGSSSAPQYTASGGVAFGFGLDGTGAFLVPAGSAAGGVAFGFSLSGTGTFTAPAVTGSGGVYFGFRLAGTGLFTGDSGGLVEGIQASLIVDEVEALAAKGQVAALSILSAGHDDMRRAEVTAARMHRGSVVAGSAMARARL